MRIYYTIEYHRENKRWVLWENTKYERGENCRGIYRGTKKDCEEKLKEIKEKKRKDEFRRKRKI